MNIKKIKIIITLILLIILLCMQTKIMASEDKSALEEVVDKSDVFLKDGEQNVKDIWEPYALAKLSRGIYNIFLVLAIIIAVIIGIVLGIQYITGTVTQKGKIKEALIPYFVGVAVALGAFTIWRIVVSTLNQTV